MQQTLKASSPFALGRSPEEKPPKSHRALLWFGFLTILVITVGTTAWLFWSIQSNESKMEASLEKRLELLANGRAEVISTWLSGLARQGDRIIQSDLFRLYATEVDLIEKDISILVTDPRIDSPEHNEHASQLAAQLPLMQNLLVEFTRYSGFISGRIINRSGQAYIATDANTTPLKQKQIELVKQTINSAKPHFAPLRHTANGLVLDIFLPILPPDATQRQKHPVAVLFLSKAVSDKINELLADSPLTVEGERTRLLQKVDTTFQEVTPSITGELRTLFEQFAIDDAEEMAFSKRPSVADNVPVYSLATRVPETPWWVVMEADYEVTRQEFKSASRSTAGIAGLTVLALAIAFGAAWFRLISTENRRIAERFQKLASQIEEQRQLLDNINSNTPQFIGLKTLEGHYRYVNPAFASAVGRTPDEVIGLDDTAVFGFDTAKRLEHSDQLVLEKLEAMTFNENLYLRSQKHHLLLTKVPFKNQQGEVAGILSIFKDVTESVEARERQQKTIQQTVEALVKAIELTDPYLAGHSRQMGAFSEEIARTLNVSEIEASTVKTAANLSQVGKVYIDRSILTKAGPLTPEEKSAMERHVENTANILKDIDFELPVFEAVCQMNEHLDGSGYPKGLTGDQITLPARILSVANSFCAMVEPRSYRRAKSPQEALEALEQAPHLYDAKVVAALREVVHSPTGEKMLGGRR